MEENVTAAIVVVVVATEVGGKVVAVVMDIDEGGGGRDGWEIVLVFEVLGVGVVEVLVAGKHTEEAGAGSEGFVTKDTRKPVFSSIKVEHAAISRGPLSRRCPSNKFVAKKRSVNKFFACMISDSAF